MRYCKDCKHYSKDGSFERCSADGALSLVTGEPGFADVERQGRDLKDYCGTNAQWFEEKPIEVKESKPATLFFRLVSLVRG